MLVSAVITDPFMAHGLKSDHASFTKSDYDENKSPDFNSDVPLQTEVTEVRYRVTRLGFEDAQHRRIGSMPVAVLEPNKWEGR